MPEKKYPLALPQGSVLAGQYIIEKVLGQGGFGITYMARDHKSGSKVAIKEFFPDSMATRMQTTVTAFGGERGESFVYGKNCFLKEAETLAEFIGNKNIVQVYSYFEENGTAYFVMDFVEGISFEQYIREHGGRVSYEEAERILIPVMDALAVVHSRGIIHRDVTPDNIYITKDGTVRLLDFGAARYSLGDKSRSLDVVLKHGFAPKEQYTRRGKQGPYTDVYTLGASLYFAITGRRPPDSIERLENDDLILPSSLGVEISPEKEDAILKAMGVQPSERFQTTEEFKRTLLVTERKASESEKIVKTEAQQIPVQQRMFMESKTFIQSSTQYQMTVQTIQPSIQYQSPVQPMQISSDAQNNGTEQKKKWVLLVKIRVGAAVFIAVIVIMVFLILRTDNQDKVGVNYDLVEDYCDNSSTDNIDNNSIEGISDDTPIAVWEPELQESSESVETVVEEEPVTVDIVEILGNTPNNLMNDGNFVYDRNKIFFAYPGGHGLASIDENGDVKILDKDGNVSCISVVDNKVYYINMGHAYCMNRDGTDRELIPELADYDNIGTLYVSEYYYYICDFDGLQCIDRKTGAIGGMLFFIDPNQLTFLNGYVYYIENAGMKDIEFQRVSLDNTSFNERELLLEKSDIHGCYGIVSEGDYIYIICQEGGTDIIFKQYSVKSKQIVCTYKLEGWLDNFSPSLINVCDKYIYFESTAYDSDGNCREAIYRFLAEPDIDSLETELVYQATDGQYLFCLSTLNESQKVVVTAWGMGDYAALIIANMDGSGEPFIIENVQEVN